MPKTVMITGAAGGLGRFVCERFLAAGTTVIGVHLVTQKPPSDGGKIQWLGMDVSDSSSVRTGVAAAQAKHGPIDALLHCAGGFRWKTIEQTSDEDIDFLLDVNLKSAMLLLRELVPGMKERNFGRIVLVSARSTFAPGAGVGVYTASKAGLNMLVGAVADEVRKHDININAVLPTIIDTPANRTDMPKADFSHWVKPEELAEVMFSLTQPWGRPIHGALIPVAGRV